MADADKPRLFIILTFIWILLQIPRLIAFPLIQSILAGEDSPAWMYPAILDIVIAFFSPFLAYALLKRKGLHVWTFAVVYFFVSMVDHGGAATASVMTGLPQAFLKMGATNTLVPIIQATFDLVVIVYLFSPRIKNYFLGSKV